jgi:integrase
MAASIRCLLLLAGQRFRQLLRATKQDYDVSVRVLRLADPKGKRSRPMEHLLPVSDAVAAELDGLLQVNTAGPYIFSTTLGEKPIHHTNLSGGIAAIAKATCAGEGRYRPGDIRRSVETRLQRLGVSRDERAQLLSHGRTSGVQGKHYERYDYLDEKRAALALWEKHLSGVINSACIAKPRSSEAERPAHFAAARGKWMAAVPSVANMLPASSLVVPSHLNRQLPNAVTWQLPAPGITRT